MIKPHARQMRPATSLGYNAQFQERRDKQLRWLLTLNLTPGLCRPPHSWAAETKCISN